MISQMIQTLLYNVGQLGSNNKSVIKGSRNNLISSKKIMDIGKEIAVPPASIAEAKKAYYSSYNGFDLKCEVLEKYLAYLKHADGQPVSRVEFIDFFIVEQAYDFAYKYLDTHDDYGYENDGLITLAAKLAIYLRDNIEKSRTYNILGPARKLNENFGGFYKYKEGFDIFTILNDDVLSEIEDIYEYEEDDDE
ncbi:hypothetical protein COJ01_17935 [Priestia megaterium]|uniref:hypothetical protein n=1 Tax=Priestia megaterium TaxID=1404 RepID=UPI000BF43EF6|nr:hypothetical protein [Priestia megaterium]PFK99927.1 hypothetical protein COJ01_17935 [Priestia megaterium]